MRWKPIFLAGLLIAIASPAFAQDPLSGIGSRIALRAVAGGAEGADQLQAALFRGLNWDQGTVSAMEDCRTIYRQILLTVPALSQEQATEIATNGDKRLDVVDGVCQRLANISRSARPQLPLVISDTKRRRKLEEAATDAAVKQIESGAIPASELLAAQDWPRWVSADR